MDSDQERKLAEKLWLLEQAVYQLEVAVSRPGTDDMYKFPAQAVRLIFNNACKILPPIRPAGF
jgi:hypothetical protein